VATAGSKAVAGFKHLGALVARLQHFPGVSAVGLCLGVVLVVHLHPGEQSVSTLLDSELTLSISQAFSE
jgi:hypothetical protein